MAHHGRKNADETLVWLLAAGLSHTDAAAKAGVGIRTVHRRKTDPTFQARVMAARTAMLEQATAQLAHAATAAVATLEALLDSKSDMARLGAARSILEFGIKMRESAEFAERLARLEAKYGGSQGT